VQLPEEQKEDQEPHCAETVEVSSVECWLINESFACPSKLLDFFEVVLNELRVVVREEAIEFCGRFSIHIA
jgi:hypothetical protein